MAQDPDEDRIRRKAHQLWEAEGHPHGRDADHWEQAREIIAIQDSHASALLPREYGAEDPVESSSLRDAYGDVPNLTDQGEHALTDISREPEAAAPVAFSTSAEIDATARLHPPAALEPASPVVAAKKPGMDVKVPAKIAAKAAGKADSSTKASKPIPAKAK